VSSATYVVQPRVTSPSALGGVVPLEAEYDGR
jgi:hypothetical protein